MQTFDVKSHSTRTWTEFFAGFDGKVSQLRSPNYAEALSEVEQWLQSPEGVSKESVDEMHEFFAEFESVLPSEVLQEGMPWGALEQLRVGEPLTTGKCVVDVVEVVDVADVATPAETVCVIESLVATEARVAVPLSRREMVVP